MRDTAPHHLPLKLPLRAPAFPLVRRRGAGPGAGVGVRGGTRHRLQRCPARTGPHLATGRIRGGCFRDRDGRAFCDRRYGNSSTSLHLDYLWESKLIDKAAQLDWHVGAGTRVFFLGDPCAYDCWDLGVRAPIGLDLTFRNPSFLEVFLEIAPVFYFAPATFLAMEGGLGVRGYF